MSALTADAGRLDARGVSRAAGFRVEFACDWKQAAARWSDFSPSTLFQNRQWLDAWYAAFAGADHVEPLIAIISDAVTSERIALLPLIRRTQNGTRIVEFADLDLTDYNAPVLGAAAPRDAKTSPRALWRDLLAALRRMPGGADLIRLRKMPVDLDGRPNPLALLDGASRCAFNGNIVTTGDDFDAYRYSLKRTVRKQLERSWRVFTRDPAAAFQIVANPGDAPRILSAMEVQQGARMQHLGLNFVLNGETCATFYRNLVGENLESGYAVLSALTVGEEVVASLLGIRSGSRYVMIRISNAGDKWSNCSPGRLIIERTMAALHKDGVRQFDFSIGNYAYKRRFGVAPLALVDITAAAELARNSLRVARSGRLRTSPSSAARHHRETCARQAALARRELNLSHHARLTQYAFQRVAIPLRRIGRRFIGALQECEQRLVRLRGAAHGVVGQDELAQRLAEECRIGTDHRGAEARWLGIGVAVERRIVDRAAARPEAGAALLMRIGFAGNRVGKLGTPPGWRGARRPEKRVAARSMLPQKKCTGLALPRKPVRNCLNTRSTFTRIWKKRRTASGS